MDVRLPSGVVLKGIPEGTSKDEIKRKAIAAGLATEADFGEPAAPAIAPQQATGEVPVLPDQMEQLPDVYAPQQKPERSMGERAYGAFEAGKAMGTGVTSGVLGGALATGIQAAREIGDGEFGTYGAARRIAQASQQGAEAYTDTPDTPTGQEYTQGIGEALAPIGGAMAGLAPISAGMGQAIGTSARMAARSPQALAAAEAAQGFAKQIDAGIAAANEKLKASIARRPGSGDSAGAAATPEAMQRIATAESLPVPVKLTKGAALREAEQLAFEKEQMKTALGGPLRDKVQENNIQILQNFDEIIDRTGAEAVFSGKAETGRSVVKALSQGLDDAKGRVRTAYDIANRSPEAQARVNSAPVFDYINAQITGEPSVAVVDSVRKYLTKNNIATKDGDNIRLARPLNVREMEEIRQVINQHVTDNSPDIRQATILKRMIDDATGEVAGPLYKKARTLRSQQARIFENRAVIARLIENKKGTLDPKVPLDKVFDKTILNSSPQEINTIRRVLNAHGDQGRQAWRDLQGATVDYIRSEATKNVGTDAAGNPIVSPAQLNRAINNLDSNGRLDVIFGKQQAQVMRDLNDVVKYVNTVPPGTLINTSGTTATLLAAMGEMGVTGAVTGLPVPVMVTLKVLKNQARDRKIKKQIQDTLNYAERVSSGANQ